MGFHNNRWLRWIAASLSLTVSISIGHAASNKLYRYVTDKGVVAIDDHVPPEFAKNGYEVLTPDGRVIETVPRQLTGEEGTRARAAEAETKRLQEWDKNLLLRYSSVDDIAAARDRALREIDVRISILRSNLLSVKGQIESEQTKAADMERRGVEVPAAITSNMDMLRREIADTEESVAERTRDKANLAAGFQKDIDRFKALQDVVAFRRHNTGGSVDK